MPRIIIAHGKNRTCKIRTITTKGLEMSQEEIETITINNVEYVRKDAIHNQEEIKGDYKIVILQRGWVMIGKLEKNGTDCKLHHASVIRNWGTTKGLGELAMEGKKDCTNLDKCGGLVEFDSLTVVATISVREDLWKKEL